MRFTGIAALALVCGGMLAAQTPVVKQDGQYWVRSGQTQPLTLPNQIQRLELYTRGHVVVRGVDSGQLQIKMQQRVRTKTRDEANREWGVYDSLQTPFSTQGDLMRIAVQPPASLRVSTDLEITVPRRLRSLQVQNQLGRVEIYDIDGDAVAVTDGGSIGADRIRGSFQSQTSGGSIEMGTIGGSVRCATGAGAVTLKRSGGEANCHTAGGDVTVGYAGGRLTLTTEGGNIRVDQAADEVRAHSTEGMIEVGQAKGAVIADTRGGLIQVGSANGVQAESANGMVRLKGASGPMNVSTMMGNILAELLTGGRLQDSSLSTGRGDITLTIPAGLGVSLRAIHPSGMAPRIVSDYPEIKVNSVGFRSPAEGQGSLNGGGPMLNLNTSGIIYVRKAKE